MKSLLFLIIFFAIGFFTYGQDFWTPAGNLSPAGDDYVMHITYNSTGTLLAYSFNRGIFRSTNNGDDWTLTAANLKVSGLYTSPDGKVFAVCQTTSNIFIKLSTDDGVTWNDVYSAQHLNNYYSGGGMVFIDNNIAVAVMSFTLGPTLGDIGVEVVRSTDGGLNWQLLFIANSWGGAEDLIRLNDGRILVTTTLSGVSYSSNSGSTWAPLTSFPPYFTNYIKTNSSGDIFLARNTASSQTDLVFRSTDNGNSWQGVGLTGGLNGGNVKALYIDHSDNVYVSLYTSSPIVRNVYRSTDNGVSWQQITSGLPSSELINSLTGNPQDVIFAGTQNSGVYKGSDAVPVELTSFAANVINNAVHLEWQTGTEINNKGFEVQRKVSEKEFETAGYVSGSGTSTKPISYNFIDEDISAGKYTYRLKQIDFDGGYEYSPEIEIEVSGITGFVLEQNYPNPFNPSTKIKYTIPSGISDPEGVDQSKMVTLRIFDILGSEVAALINEVQGPGIYEITWNAENIPGGVYFYRIQAGSFVEIKKMTLMK